jgi:hypothetical protein
VASNNFASIRRMRMDASSCFWLWATGLYKGNPAALAATVKEAKMLGCSQARADWIEAVLGATRGTFAPKEPQP